MLQLRTDIIWPRSRTRLGMVVRPSLIALGIFCMGQAQGQVSGGGLSATPTPPAASAQPAPADSLPTGVRELTLTPSPALPRALLWQFRFPASQELPGNAAIGYLQVAGAPTISAEALERVSELVSVPLDQLQIEQAQDALDKTFGGVWELVSFAARREDCRWETPVREAGIGALMPELGKFRTLARFAALRARMEIRAGRYAEAIETLRLGLSLGRDVGSGPTLIHGLVGVAISQLMLQQIELLIQQPGAPNLYWALTDLGTPLVDMSRALHGEQAFVDYLLPAAAEFETELMTPAAAADAVARINKAFAALQGELGSGDSSANLSVAAMSAVQYPAAKQYLIDQGATAEQVAALPVSYVSLRYALFNFRTATDDLYKWTSLPYHQAARGLQQAEAKAERLSKSSAAQPFSLLIPTIGRAVSQAAHLERKLAMLRVAEAIRLHAGTHGGVPPASLDAMEETPIPVDPVTGRAFELRADGAMPVLTAPSIDTGAAPRQGELREYRMRFAPAKPETTK